MTNTIALQESLKFSKRLFKHILFKKLLSVKNIWDSESDARFWPYNR